MSLSDKRLLIELGAVLAIKIVALFLIKVCFFPSTTGSSAHPLTAGGFSDEHTRATESTDSTDEE